MLCKCCPTKRYQTKGVETYALTNQTDAQRRQKPAITPAKTMPSPYAWPMSSIALAALDLPPLPPAALVAAEPPPNPLYTAPPPEAVPTADAPPVPVADMVVEVDVLTLVGL